MTVNYEEYRKIKKNFFNRHNGEFKTFTSPMDKYGTYHKEYVFEDGATFYEVMSPEFASKEVEVEIKMVKIVSNVEVKLFKTEFWSSDDAVSRCYYEKF